ncbi:MAG: arsenic resistance N-acetyltransferase ArsN2 [Vicinamibacterales bacterium]
MTIDEAGPGDLAAVRTLLAACGLPLDGLDACADTLLVARARDRVIGCAAIERHPPYALLRSVAVDAGARGQGLGQLLTAEALALARRLDARAVFLLTETAEGFFPRAGFRAVARDAVPAEVRDSVEFTSACPASAAAMRLDLS